MGSSEWFDEWFDSKYYHILYQHRDYKEAERFIRNLIDKLALPDSGGKIIDLACGKGRHSIYLNKLGYDVLGLDLSKDSISHAKVHGNERLDFKVHDMREDMPVSEVQAVFNLFTSFGYFDDMNDNVKVLNSIHQSLQTEGTVLIDFLNAEKVIKNLTPHEVKHLNDIEFKITRKISGKKVIKTIEFDDEGKSFKFQEEVSLLTRSDFGALFKSTGFNVKACWGDYDLGPYDETSDRLIYWLQPK